MKKLFYTLLLVLGVVFVASCNKDGDEPLMVNMKGEVALSTTSVYEGKEITVSIKDLAGLEILTGKEYAGKQKYGVEVTYLLDGIKIGTSASMADGFSVAYTVGKLPLGAHTITAEVSGGNGMTLMANIKSANLDVDTKPVDLTLTLVSSIIEDLMDLVEPVLTYEDAEGSHEMALSKDLYERYVIEHDDYRRVGYNWEDDLILKIRDAAKISLRYAEKKDAKYDEAKRYKFSEKLSVRQYSYWYNKTLLIGTITNIVININTNIGDLKPSEDDGAYNAEQAKEYVRRLCATPQELNVAIDMDGHLIINGETF